MATLTFYESSICELVRTRSDFAHFLLNTRDDIWTRIGIHDIQHSNDTLPTRCLQVLAPTLGYLLATALSLLAIYSYAYVFVVLVNLPIWNRNDQRAWPLRPPPPDQVQKVAANLYVSYFSVMFTQERSMSLYMRLLLGVSVYPLFFLLTAGVVGFVGIVVGIGKVVAAGLYWPEGLNKNDGRAELPVDVVAVGASARDEEIQDAALERNRLEGG